MSKETNDFWDELYIKTGNKPQSPHTVTTHNKLKSIIPEDVKTILDAGCGGGALMAFLSKEDKYTIEGVDQSSEGVRNVIERLDMKAQVGDITNLFNFPDNSFDLVVCSEVIEHLPMNILANAIKELLRVTNKYLIITNPYQEKLDYYHFTCDHCLTRYHPGGHIHSIDESFIKENVSPWAESISFFYSGQREFTSRKYASLLRAIGYRLLNLETCCPLCGAKVPFKEWSIAVRVSGHAYRTVQKTLTLLGVYGPANIITFVKKTP